MTAEHEQVAREVIRQVRAAGGFITASGQIAVPETAMSDADLRRLGLIASTVAPEIIAILHSEESKP